MIRPLYEFLYFLAGIFLHMSVLHYFSFYEVQHDPLIARSVTPYLASKLWATVQLFCGIIILVFGKFQFGLNIPSLFVALGFAFWGVLTGMLSSKRYPRQQTDLLKGADQN